MAKTAITTTGELRNFLVEVIADLREKKIDVNEAKTYATLASAVTASLASEAKIHDLIGVNISEELGHLPIKYD